MNLFNDKEIALKYLEKNSYVWNEIKNASFAYHFVPGENSNAHQFSGPSQDRKAKCLRCNRTREDVRWNYTSNNPECENPLNIDTKNIINNEEKLFEKLFIKAQNLAENLNYENLSGEYLCILHHTHGIDPSMLECALLKLDKKHIPENIIDDYYMEYSKHKETGKLGFKPTIITVKEHRNE